MSASSRRRRRRRGQIRSRRLIWAMLGLTLCLAATFAALESRNAPSDDRAAPIAASTTLWLDGAASPQFAGEIIADKFGYFRTGATSGIQLHYTAGKYSSGRAGGQPAGSGAARGHNGVLVADGHGAADAAADLKNAADADFPSMVAREHAMGITTGQKFLLAAWRGVPITAFGASLLDTSIALFSLPKLSIRAPKDLLGKRLAYRPGSEGPIVFNAMMAQLGLPRSQVTLVASDDGFSALRKGEVDAVIADLSEQPLPTADDSTRLIIIKPQDYGIHIPGLVYFASSDLVRDHPTLISQTLQAVIRGWLYAYADYKKSTPLIVSSDPQHLSPLAVEFALQQQRDLVRPVGTRIAEYDETRWATLRDILLFSKLGEQTQSLSSIVSYEFLREVYRRPPDLEATGTSKQNWPDK